MFCHLRNHTTCLDNVLEDRYKRRDKDLNFAVVSVCIKRKVIPYQLLRGMEETVVAYFKAILQHSRQVTGGNFEN
jgi:hypothetical protein